jgi:hypothetical protein
VQLVLEPQVPWPCVGAGREGASRCAVGAGGVVVGGAVVGDVVGGVSIHNLAGLGIDCYMSVKRYHNRVQPILHKRGADWESWSTDWESRSTNWECRSANWEWSREGS